MSIRRNLLRLVAAFVILAAALGGVGVVAWVAADHLLVNRTAEGACWRFASHNCWDLSVGFISRATGLDLPAGTVVRDSRTGAWLSWDLSATVVYPKGATPPAQSGTSDSITRVIDHTGGRAIVSINLVEHGGSTWTTPH